jgi:DNA polymerase alpha subunit A
MSTTRSKRAIKKVGVTEGKMKALAELKKLKDEGGKRTDQYEVEDVP